MGRRRSTSSVSTMQIVGALVMLLVLGILLALVLAPQKPLAPPNSVLTYEERPAATPDPPRSNPPDLPPLQTEPVPSVPQILPAVMVDEPPIDPDAPVFTITGTVTDEETGKPVGDARISAQRVWTPAEEADWRAREQAALSGQERDMATLDALRLEDTRLRHQVSVTSDRDGRFALSTPHEGSYSVVTRASGYLQSSPETADLSGDDPTAAIAFALGRGASIAGRVTESGSSRGAAEIPVERRVVSKSGSSRSTFDSITTDEEGRYTLSGLEPGEYEITLNLSDVPYGAGKVLPYRRVKVSNPRQKLTNINFNVEAAGIVWGYVTTPDKEPVRSDLVLCTTESLVTQFVKAAIKQKEPVNSHSRSEDGYYELVGIPLNQEWHIYATTKDYPPQLTKPFVLTQSHRSARVDVFMFAGTNIYGYVTDSRGDPVRGAEVVCVPSVGKLLAPMENPHAFRENSSDEDGNFVITQVPAGNYQIYAMKQGFKYSVMGKPVFPDGYNDIENVHMVLQAVDEGEHEVYGTVVDAAGDGLSGVSVNLRGLSTESMNSTEMTTATDGNGQFYFGGVEVGVYELVANLEGYASRRLTRVLMDRENTITLSPGSVIRGVVLVKETNQPPSYYTVRAVPITGQGTVSSLLFTDNVGARSGSFNYPDGRFELSVSGGFYRLEAKAGNLTPGRQEIDVVPGDVVDGITLYVSERGGELSGRVRVADGSSPQGAQVYLTEAGTSAQEVLEMAFASGSGDARQVVGEDGAFLFENRPEGTYNLIAQHPSYAAAESGPIDLAAGGRASGIELVLGTGGGLEGYVFKNDAAVPGALVVVMAKGQPRTATADDSGWYSLSELPPGLVQAVVMPTGVSDVSGLMGLGSVSGMQTAAIEIESGRTTRYDFGAMSGIRIVGRISPRPVNPLVGGAVVLRRPGSPLVPQCGTVEVIQLSDGGVTAAVSGNGEFTIEDVPPGDWQIDAYYSGPGMGFMQLTYRNSALVQVTGDEPGGEVPVEIEAPPCS